ncbi:Nucleolar protein 14 [Fasciola gigantica]|uniref:Nucleolar protein 14 n=1 Tax=Fasciola gigantica TaxID=46835 RepID=A0A504YDY5_FASGI|nr:Nucleolar protein 14 [Fasciola gigantica]
MTKKSNVQVVKGGEKSREKLMKTQLKRLGKVGGIKDSRFGVRDKTKSEQEKYLQRHIVERLRHLDELQFEKDEEDPMVRAAFGDQSDTKRKSLRMDELSDVGIHAHVTQEFFSKGSSSRDFRDTLTEKIAQSKLEKLKRVEENEEQRDRLKTVDSDWSQKIRFLLSGISIKSKKSTSEQVVKNRTNFQQLLETMSSDKRVAPVGTVVSTPDLEEKKLLRLQSLLSERPLEKSIDVKPTGEPADRRKNVGHLLRILLQIPEHRNAVLIFLTDILASLRPQRLKEVIHLLWLAQVVLDYCEKHFLKEQYSHTVLNSQTSGSGAYCPELVQALTSIVGLTRSSILAPPQSGSQLDESAYEKLDIRLTDPSVKLPREELPLIRLSCLSCLINLCTRTHTLYSKLLPSTVCAQLFAPIRCALTAVDRCVLPAELSQRMETLLDAIKAVACCPTPQFLTANIRLTVLSTEQSEEPRVLKTMGLIPQLEPKFDEKLDARRPKKVDPRRSVQRKLAREKRGAMREMRRDSQFLATHQLEMTKLSDEDRNRKTQAILRSIRSIED